jgi:hypothetical protein
MLNSINVKQHERGRLWLVKTFVNELRRGKVHVNASRKTFKNIYARFRTFHRMGASQERAVFFNATLLVVTKHPGGPSGRRKFHSALPLRAFLYYLGF